MEIFHIEYKLYIMSYISCLPKDLLPSLFLKFSYDEFYILLIRIYDKQYFDIFFNYSLIWIELWKRHISSIVKPSGKASIDADIYIEIWQSIHRAPMLRYLAMNGY